MRPSKRRNNNDRGNNEIWPKTVTIIQITRCSRKYKAIDQRNRRGGGGQTQRGRKVLIVYRATRATVEEIERGIIVRRQKLNNWIIIIPGNYNATQEKDDDDNTINCSSSSEEISNAFIPFQFFFCPEAQQSEGKWIKLSPDCAFRKQIRATLSRIHFPPPSTHSLVTKSPTRIFTRIITEICVWEISEQNVHVLILILIILRSHRRVRGCTCAGCTSPWTCYLGAQYRVGESSWRRIRLIWSKHKLVPSTPPYLRQSISRSPNSGFLWNMTDNETRPISNNYNNGLLPQPAQNSSHSAGVGGEAVGTKRR